MKKKILLSLILISLLLSFMPILSSKAAGTDVVFTIGNINGQKGQTYTVVVNMNCTTNFPAANLVLSYDSNVLEYVPYYNTNNEVDYNQNCGETLLNSGGTPNGTILINSATAGTIKIGYMSTTSLAGKSGSFLKFKFKVKTDATAGNSSLTVTSTTLKDVNGNNLNPQFNNGIISVLSGITLNKTSMQMIVGDQDELSVSSSNGTIYDTVTWVSSNNNVVRVTPNTDSKKASITALDEGTATITATVGGVRATCAITVEEPEEIYSISINNPAWSFLPVGQIRKLAAIFDPSTSANGKTITWSSANTNIATINSSTGEITAKAKGSTTITATDGNKSATYTLNVNKTLGDIDEDSKITSYDAYRALVLSVDQNSGSQINQDEVVVLDVDKSDSMSSNDAYMILKYSVGLITSF